MRIVKQNRFKNLSELHKEWTEAGVKTSRATTHRRVKEFGYSCRIPLVKPLLNHRQRQRRTHSLRYFYTGVSGVSGLPELTVVGLVDDQQFMYFDSNTKKAVPKTEWMRQSEGADYWDEETQNDNNYHESFKKNIQKAKERFNQTTVQRAKPSDN
uniref:MHC class I-like antigen recognition-like domain-containing protein n=1 Tax=Cyprinus carpio TaxID=7962 RepID=A0A8C1P327_CYPCA